MFIMIVSGILYLLPPINEVPESYSAVLLWNFRMTSLGMHAMLWAGLALGFGALAERVVGDRKIHRRAAQALP
ncbi:hypothetical protein GFB56_24995 [Ensifer sp. T173]|uniref:Uncharacterized protein n=1 Tax=Ensifer canadensis TaxID=555315 RepID=A0AAW4FRM4_9HYPH|nr:CbtA family protein [Ensifer canadensis]MBM3094014.1 hypothetical protein [Ensifer canadensis]UBI81074.1 CbtA family protein [Ensifer canadensis]